MSYLRLLSYESLSNQKQKDSPRRSFGQSLYFNPFAAFGAGLRGQTTRKAVLQTPGLIPWDDDRSRILFASIHD
jgi:hypothetical protein